MCLKFDAFQSEVFMHVMAGDNVAFIGQAGCGKTTLINFIKSVKKDCVICAPTAAAARHINGRTIHHTFGATYSTSLTHESGHEAGITFGKFTQETMLIIDEISMVGQSLFQYINGFCQGCTEVYGFFGGVQVLVCGDFRQLPPVRASSLCLDPKLMGNFVCISSPCNYRAQNSEYEFFLSALRMGEFRLNVKVKKIPNEKSLLLLMQDGYTIVAYHNECIQALNNRMVDSLPGNSMVIKMDGDVGDWRDKSIPKELHLKKHIKLIITHNFTDSLYNGTMVYLIKLKNEQMTVYEPDSEKTYHLRRKTYSDKRDGILYRVSQYPVKLAYAGTVYRFQGHTLAKVFVHLNDFPTDSPGSIYTAFSRGQSWNSVGVYVDQLSNITKKNVFLHESNRYLI